MVRETRRHMDFFLSKIISRPRSVVVPADENITKLFADDDVGVIDQAYNGSIFAVN